MTAAASISKSTGDDLLSSLVALRHELHQYPEIRFEEHATSDRIAAFLDSHGIAYERGFAKGTGIVATVEGAQAGPTVALRADMDALEIEEQTNLPWASRIPQRMHACGHDGHMAVLCGASATLQAMRHSLSGRIKCIFQPAEEQAAGGRFIVQEGVLKDVSRVFALHGWPTLPVGHVGVKAGAMMASADFFNIQIRGKGCHGADPASGIDPIVVAAHIVTALQTVVSREIDPWREAVVTVARIEAGFASNVIPEVARLEGTFRALNHEVRDHLRVAIERMATQVAAAFRASATVRFGDTPYPPLRTDPAITAFAKAVAETLPEVEKVHEFDHPFMTAEDFAFYLEEVPGTFLCLGTNPDGASTYPPLHSSRYDFTDTAIPVGVSLLTALARRSLDEMRKCASPEGGGQ